MSLSSSIDRAVKAYADHTDAVMAGDHTLDVSGLLMPFNQITQFAHQFNPAFFPQYSTNETAQQAPVAPMEGAPTPVGKKKRAYKQRDKDAPKRPLTAYFRFLREQRPLISAELAETPGGEGGKAGDISKIATERWHALTDAQRNPYKLAYQHELEQYEVDTKAYKDGLATGAVKLDDEVMDTPTAGPAHVVAKADDTSDDDSDASSSSDDASSDEDSDEEKPIPAKAPSPPRKTPKSAKKSVTAAASAAPAPAPTMFSSFNPTGVAPSPAAGQKRKSDDEESSKKKKKRGRPNKAEQEAAASAASQLVAADEEAEFKKEKKEKKKKRKSEAA